jgi:hypothetical protein
MEVLEHVLVLRADDVRALLPVLKAGLSELAVRGRLSPDTDAACQRLGSFLAEAATVVASGRELGRELTRVGSSSVVTQSASDGESVSSLAQRMGVTSDRVRQFLRSVEASGRRLPRVGRRFALIPADVGLDFEAQLRRANQ